MRCDHLDVKATAYFVCLLVRSYVNLVCFALLWFGLVWFGLVWFFGLVGWLVGWSVGRSVGCVCVFWLIG